MKHKPAIVVTSLTAAFLLLTAAPPPQKTAAESRQIRPVYALNRRERGVPLPAQQNALVDGLLPEIHTHRTHFDEAGGIESEGVPPIPN